MIKHNYKGLFHADLVPLLDIGNHIFLHQKDICVFRPNKTKVEQRLQIGIKKKTFADLGDDDRDVSHQIQKPKIIP